MPLYDLNKKSLQWLTLFFLAFIWGSSFILMKKGLVAYNHTQVAALRIGIAFLCLMPFAIKPLLKIEKRYWKYLFISGFLGNGIPAFLFTKAQTEVASSLAGMLNSLTPIFTLIIALLIFKSKPKRNQIIGVFIGLIGAISLILSNGVSLENTNLIYSLFIVTATFFYGISVNVIKIKLSNIKPITISALAFLCIGPWTIIYLFTTNFIEITTTNPEALESLFYISLLAIFGTAIAMLIFNTLIKKTTSLFASSVTYLIPIISILWGVIDGETIQLIQVTSVFTILLGIYFTNRSTN
ncbi:MAG: DMT family transporter [Vicingus serpentipes]|nr:DMT family transporter [Vicingus serpentipes]